LKKTSLTEKYIIRPIMGSESLETHFVFGKLAFWQINWVL